MTPEQARAIASATCEQAYPEIPASELQAKANSPWVIKAILTAVQVAYQNGEATAQAEHRLLAESIEDKYVKREDALIRSTCAALIEAIYDDMPIGGKPEHPFVIVSVDKQATIWDRWTLTHKLQNDNTLVLMTLERKQ